MGTIYRSQMLQIKFQPKVSEGLWSALPPSLTPHFSLLVHNYRGVGATVDCWRIGVESVQARQDTEFCQDRSWASVRKTGSKFKVMTSALP